MNASHKSGSIGAVVLILAVAVSVAAGVWFMVSTFLPLAYTKRPLEYVFIGASPWLLAITACVCAVALGAVHRLFVGVTREGRWTARSMDYLVPLTAIAIAPLGAAPLLWNTPALSPLTFVLVDLRLWWVTAAIVAAVWRFDRRRGSPWRATLTQRWQRRSRAERLFALDALLLCLLAGTAMWSQTHLRFTSALHGDEPKYLRLCENLYQGLGLDVGHQRTIDELSLGYTPPIWRNAWKFFQAIREDVRFFVADLRRIGTTGLTSTYNRGEFIEGWFVRGRNGGVYQVHNPGLSIILFPAYFLDRHFLSTSAGYQGIFPTTLATTNLLCLVIWSVWGIVLFRFLRACFARDGLAWLLAAAAMLTLPVAAFPFQIYPEAVAGLILTSVCSWLFFGDPNPPRLRSAMAAGIAVGGLPWLHVRFLLLSCVLAVWVIGTLKGHRRRAFAAAYAVMIAGICLYSYHVTGSFRPDAMYEAEGSTSPWRLHDAIASVIAYPFDRIWGLLAHAPVFVVALAGWIPAARARPRVTGLVAVLIATLALSSAGHGFGAGGGTPLRHLVSVVPLAMVPLGYALVAWGDRRWVRVTFAILLVVSLQSALSYNLQHHKEVGRFVAHGISGWAPNLVLPWTHGDTLARTPGSLALLILWVILCAALLVIPLYRKRGLDSGGRADPLSTQHVFLAATLFVMIASGATALGGEWVRADYFVPVSDAREALVVRDLSLRRCNICYSSARGEVGRANIVADSGHSFTFSALRGELSPGEPVTLLADATVSDGRDFGSLAIDFGDNRTERIQLHGRQQLEHVYDRAGEYRIRALFAPHDGPTQERFVDIRIVPSTVVSAAIGDPPIELTRTARIYAVSEVTLESGNLTVKTTAGAVARTDDVWLMTFDGNRWRVRSRGGRNGSDGSARLSSAQWVGVIASGADWRTEPVVVRWPAAELAIGAPVVLYTRVGK